MQFADDTPPPDAVPALAPRLAIVVAMADNGVIGVDNRLPWRLPEDLRHFRALTTGHAVIMGRRTWESLPRALPDRQNIVVTRRPGYVAAGAEVAPSLEAALALVRLAGPAFCIGGAELYAAALPLADEMQVTEVAGDPTGDTWFPAFDRSAWIEVARRPGALAEDGKPACHYVTLSRAR
jgi:dihydrofolate reductase